MSASVPQFQTGQFQQMSYNSFATPGGGYEGPNQASGDVDMNMNSANIQYQQPQDLFETQNNGSSRDEPMRPGTIENCGQIHGTAFPYQHNFPSAQNVHHAQEIHGQSANSGLVQENTLGQQALFQATFSDIDFFLRRDNDEASGHHIVNQEDSYPCAPSFSYPQYYQFSNDNSDACFFDRLGGQPESEQEMMQSAQKDDIFDVDQDEHPETSMQEDHDGSDKINHDEFHERRHIQSSYNHAEYFENEDSIAREKMLAQQLYNTNQVAQPDSKFPTPFISRQNSLMEAQAQGHYEKLLMEGSPNPFLRHQLMSSPNTHQYLSSEINLTNQRLVENKQQHMETPYAFQAGENNFFNASSSRLIPQQTPCPSDSIQERRMSEEIVTPGSDINIDEVQPQQQNQGISWATDEGLTPTPQVIDDSHPEEEEDRKDQYSAADTATEENTEAPIINNNHQVCDDSMVVGIPTTKAAARRRGAPNKGPVSNNQVEKCKPQRQKVFRLFKQFYERRIMPSTLNEVKKRRKVKDGLIREEEQYNLSANDLNKLLAQSFLASLPDHAQTTLLN